MKEPSTTTVEDDGPTSVCASLQDDVTLVLGVEAGSSKRAERATLVPWFHGSFGGRGLELGALACATLLVLVAAWALRERATSTRLRRALDQRHSASDPGLATDDNPSAPAASEAVRSTQSDPRVEAIDTDALIRRAAVLLVSNRHREAAAIYERLATLLPDQPVFTHLATILNAKLACHRRSELGGSLCD